MYLQNVIKMYPEKWVLEHLFKIAVLNCADCNNYADSWIEQIHNIHFLWNKLIEEIDKDKLIRTFEMYCLTYGVKKENLNISDAFKFATTSWRLNLMFLVANKIGKKNVFGASDVLPIVKWSGHMMLVNWGSLHIIL